MDNRDKIIKLIQQVAKSDGVPAADESLFDSGVLDSFALPELVSAIEAEFGIKIPDSDLNPRKFDSVERIESYIESRQ